MDFEDGSRLPMTKRERLTRKERRRQTREHLLGAARELFIQEGFEATSLAAVADMAGYTRGAFYSNFDDKADLLIEVLRRQQERLSHTLIAMVLQLHRRVQDGDCFSLWVEACLLAKRDAAFRAQFECFLRGLESAGSAEGDAPASTANAHP